MEEPSADNKKCTYFCGEFLECLPDELQDKIVDVLHSVLQKKYPDPHSMCQGVLKELHGASEVDCFHFSLILKQMCLSLLKISESEAAVSLVEGRLRHLNIEDCMTLLILGVVHDKTGNYENALECYQRAIQSAKENNNKHQEAFTLLKLATSTWNLEQPESSRHYIDKAEQAFSERDCNADNVLENVYLLTDYYKTMGYLNRVTNKPSDVVFYYLKAMDLIKEHSSSIIQELKVLTQLAGAHALDFNDLSVFEFNSRSVQIIEEILENSAYVSVHTSQMMHIMSRIAYAYKRLKHHEEALRVDLMNLKVARNFLGDAHPEVARKAIDVAILYQNLCCHRESVTYLDVCENSLRECNYKNDDNKMKLYVRELSDTLYNLAYLQSRDSNYSHAEESYKEALSINTKVYGEMSFRTAKVMHFLARLYSRWHKNELAKEYFQKSLMVVQQFQPDNHKLLDTIRRELDNVGIVRKKTNDRPRKMF